MLRTILLCTLLGLFSDPSRANPTPAAPPVMNDAETLAALELQSAVREAYRLYFESLGLPLPDLETNVQVSFVPGSTKQIASATIDTRLNAASSPPDQIIREARQAVARRLAELGYEVAGQDTASDHDEGTAAAPAPRATLLIDVITPQEPQGLADRLRLGPILVVTAMALTALLCAVISVLMLRRLWRTLRAPMRRDDARSKPEREQKLPTIEAPGFASGPMPAQADSRAIIATSSQGGPGRKSSQHAAASTGREPEVLPPVPDTRSLAMKDAQGELPPLPPVFEAFERLPFDEAVRAFSAFDQEMRTAIFERLGINPSVRHRIEQELSQIQAT